MTSSEIFFKIDNLNRKRAANCQTMKAIQERLEVISDLDEYESLWRLREELFKENNLITDKIDELEASA